MLCVGKGWSQGRSTPTKEQNKTKQGTASWYGEKFHGRKTANGEIYNMWHPGTVATRDRTIPFGTKIRVTNLLTGKSIIVRVNDRMAKTGKHSIDLSVGAFIKLAPRQQGVIKIKYEIIKLDDEKEKRKTTKKDIADRFPFVIGMPNY